MSAAQWWGEHWIGLVVAINAAALLLMAGMALLVRRASSPYTRLSLVSVLMTVAVFGAIAFAIETQPALLNFDHGLAATLGRALSIDVLRVWIPITHLGDGVTRVVLGAGVALLLVRRQPRLCAAWLIALIGNGALNRVLKQLFVRERPAWTHDLVTETSWSFPSGHASGAMVTFGMLGFVVLRVAPPRWRLSIVIATAVLVANVGLSRVLLQVHFFSDVMAGFAIGATWLAVCIGALLIIEDRREARSA